MIVWSDTQPGRLYPLMDREGNYVAIVTSPELNPKHDLYYQYCLETEDRYIAYVLNKKIYRNDIRLYYKKKPVAIKNYFDPPKITLAEASRMTNIPINTLRGQCQRGEIPDVQQLGDQRIYLLPRDWAEEMQNAKEGYASIAEAARRSPNHGRGGARNTGKRRKKTEEAEMISVSAAAALTGISDRTLRRMCVAGDIPGVQLVGKTHVIPRYWAKNCAEAVNRSVSYNEAAEIAGVTVQAISTAAIRGRLQRVGKRITKDSLNKYIERRQK